MDKVIVHIPLYISYNNCTVKNHIYGQGHVIPQQLQLYIEATTMGGVARNIECGKIFKNVLNGVIHTLVWNVS